MVQQPPLSKNNSTRLPSPITNTSIPPPLHCQCGICQNPVKKGETFCDYHLEHKCSIQSPITGYEPIFDPNTYNGDKAIQHSHNCFAYAMNVRDKKKIERCRQENSCRFHVPGKTKGHSDFTGNMGKTCSDVIGRTMADVPNAYLSDFSTKCQEGYSKIGVVVDQENDLHYYRQDKDGWWSHKPGARAVTRKDATGANIYAPHRASRFYPPENKDDTGLNYSSFCSYMCVPRNQPIMIAGGKRSSPK
jgi:hypothetical protein